MRPSATLADMLRSPFNQGISEMGFVCGQNVTCECRWAEFYYPALAADLVARKVDVIVTFGGTTPALAAKKSNLDSRSGQLAALASRYAVPAILESRGFALAGGLISMELI